MYDASSQPPTLSDHAFFFVNPQEVVLFRSSKNQPVIFLDNQSVEGWFKHSEI